MANQAVTQRDSLGDFETAILVAIVQLQKDAYGMTIRRFLSEELKRDVAIGAVYTTLERLGPSGKGMVDSHEGNALPIRGGRARRYYRVTEKGRKALIDTFNVWDFMKSTFNKGGECVLTN